jgi:carboxymethylenebutenolidase
VGIETQLQLAANLRCPLMLHFGDQDPYVPHEALQTIAHALGAKPSVELHVYPGANHGFYTRGAESDVALARERTCAFLQQALA